jgi:hypothetical protein
MIACTGCLALPGKTKPDASTKRGVPARIDPGPWAGPLAQKHAGKVVFSSAPIPRDGADDSAAYTSYTLGEPLFMRYWGKDSPHNLQPCDQHSVRTLHLYADVNGAAASRPIEQLASFGSYEVSGELVIERGMSSLSNELEHAFTSPTTFTGDRATAGEATIRTFNTKIIPMLREGENTLRIILALSCANDPVKVIVADGTLAVRVPPGAMAAYMAKYGPRVKQSPHPENEKLVREILTHMKKKPDWNNEVLVGALVTSEAWQPVRHPDTGVLVAYEINALLFARLKKEQDPEQCRAFQMTYQRDAAGGTLYLAGTGTSQPFPCSAAPR